MNIAADIMAMLLALDKGEVSCLPILADALEECGDRRADGLRLVIKRADWPRYDMAHAAIGPFIWFRCNDDKDWFTFAHFISPKIFDKLEGGTLRGDYWRHYETISSALLALAEALSQKE